MKRVLIIAVAVALFFVSFLIYPNYIKVKSADDLDYYVLADGTAKVIDYKGDETKVKIPETIDGIKISNIADKSIGYTDENGEKVKINDFLINGYYGSAAYKYAEREGILFNCLHKFKTEILKQPTYAQKGSKKLTCDCGFTQTVDIDYVKIPDVKLNSVKADGDSIVLSWNKIDEISSYNVYRSVDKGEYKFVTTAKGNIYYDYESDSGNIEYYVTGVAGKNEGKKGVSPKGISYFKSPSTVLDSKDKGILVSWNDSKNAVKYRVYKMDANKKYQKIYETDDNNTHSYLDKNVIKQSEYFYSVVAVDKSGKESTKLSKGKSLVFGKHSKVVYLTFDDGPSENTMKILSILKKYNAKATFFVTANGKTEYMKNIVDAGHRIALHSYTHKYELIYSSVDAYFNDLNKLHDLVLEKTGVDSRLIRFPGGASNTISANYCKGIMSKLTKMVEEQGYKYFDWNVSSGDADGNGIAPSKLIRNVKRESKGVDRCVVLMHDTLAKSTTVSALDSICSYYKQQGYEFSSLSTNSLPCHQAVNN